MKNQSHTQKPYTHDDEKGGFPWLLFIIGIASVLIILQVFGVYKTVDTEHKATVMDVHSGEYQNRTLPKERLEKINKPTPEVDNVLSAIKEEYESPVFTDIRTANDHNNWGLTDDEAKFYDDMRVRYGGTRDNWLGVVQKANHTYKTIKEIFGGRTDVVTVLHDSRAATTVFSRIQQTFGISTLDCLNFAQSGRANRLSDWANFIEAKSR
ncbi:MAG: hypothetical protein JNL70_07645 [Saprospiraceae bacterium]|nr:hypothetical protein [Saprospiraceae bacterium]